jgi:hypothetical protein
MNPTSPRIPNPSTQFTAYNQNHHQKSERSQLENYHRSILSSKSINSNLKTLPNPSPKFLHPSNPGDNTPSSRHLSSPLSREKKKSTPYSLMHSQTPSKFFQKNRKNSQIVLPTGSKLSSEIFKSRATQFFYAGENSVDLGLRKMG